MAAPEQRLLECPQCGGAGEVTFNRSRGNDPQCDESMRCGLCYGTGQVDGEDVDPDGDYTFDYADWAADQAEQAAEARAEARAEVW